MSNNISWDHLVGNITNIVLDEDGFKIRVSETKKVAVTVAHPVYTKDWNLSRVFKQLSVTHRARTDVQIISISREEYLELRELIKLYRVPNRVLRGTIKLNEEGTKADAFVAEIWCSEEGQDRIPLVSFD